MDINREMEREGHTKREELLLRRVLALPKLSRIGLARSTCCSTPLVEPATSARYCKINFVASVLPAPDSPLHNQ